MPVVLKLLSDVRWRGQPVAGDRARTLLAALAFDGGRPVQQQRLIELVGGEEEPANSAKGLQVLVSRTRSAVGGDAIVRDGGGYRLGVEPAEVDSIRLSELVHKAKAAERDAASAAGAASAALELGAGLQALTDGEVGPLRDLRSTAAEELAAAGVILARARSRTGAHTEALPALERFWAQNGSDESLFADLLHSEAVVHGPAAALERYEQYRRDLREGMGSNPGSGSSRSSVSCLP